MNTVLKNTLAVLAFAGGLYLSLELSSCIHSRHCDGCNWFWCDNYDGSEVAR